MLDDLENEHELIGESSDEIIQLLGQPTYTSQDQYCYQYYVGDSLIDPITFDIFFSDGMVIKTKLTER